MTTWRLVLEYDGAGFVGWQVQPRGRTVQGVVQEAVVRIMGGERVSVQASGRTDTGVHALAQVCSFRATPERTAQQVLKGLNACLPPDVACLEATVAPPEFHARFSATGKRYRYVLRNGPVRSALRRERCWQVRWPLDLEAMREALQHLPGEHDFTSFRAAGCAARSPVRTLNSAELHERGDEIWVELHGKGFLRHMVRNVVGSLVEVGRGRHSPDWFAHLLRARDRGEAGPTAPGAGLFLVKVDYPDDALGSLP